MELLQRTTESMHKTPNVAWTLQIAVTAGEGLLALARGEAGEAVRRLEAAVAREQELGRTYDAACLELDLARALEAAGEKHAAQRAQARAASILEPLGCMNAF